MSARKYPGDFINRIICGDCLEVMKEMPGESVDLVITDPPYNRGCFSDNIITLDFLDELKRVLKAGSNIYCFWTPKTFSEFEVEFRKRFTLLNIIICHFLNKTGFDSPYRFEKSYEPIYFGSKGNSKKRIVRLENGDCFDVWKATLPQTNFKGIHQSFHPTQKPVEIIRKMILHSSNDNDIILDPFLGSGTTVEACKLLKRNFIGIEIDPNYCKIAEERLAQEVL